MDTSASNIIFNDDGVCNFCENLISRHKEGKSNLSKYLSKFIDKIKVDGKNKKYDCIVGLSGGVDSAYTLNQVMRLGLRPLVVHMDNGWNSELANNNIEKIIQAANVDYYTHVIDWNEYKSLMNAFFDADVIDIELLYDNAMLAVNYRMAAKFGIKYILSGSNITSEGMQMPENWTWMKKDKKNIQSIARRKNIKIKTFPIIGTFDYLFYRFIKKIEWISFLDYLDYDKSKAMDFLQKNYGFKPYPYKHYESVFTRFYQGHLLPTKFNVDKRKLHSSSLICSNQTTRSQALEELESIPYHSSEALNEDKEYFLKKMGWSESQLINYCNRKEKLHSDYGSEKPFWDFCLKTYQFFFKSP
tara:strand:- start:542 stop:1615 length:1074 start_codon:yes stop_codon:yes gene_type:complete